jgi:hypothetical protein
MSDQHTNHTNRNGTRRSPSDAPQDEPERAAGEAPPREAGTHGEQQCLDFCPICRTADVLRASAPPELREQWQTVQREALLTTKALIEHYLTRLDEEPGPRSSQVEDIPIL